VQKRLYALFQFATSTERRKSTSVPALAFGSVARKTRILIELGQATFSGFAYMSKSSFLYYMKSALHFTVFFFHSRHLYAKLDIYCDKLSYHRVN